MPGAYRAAISRRRLQPVSDTADRADQRGTELAAEGVDVDLDDVAFDFLAPAVQTFLDLRARQNTTRMLHQREQHGELPRRKRHRMSVLSHLPAGRIERDATMLEPRVRAALPPPQHGADTRGELRELEGLHHVVVRTGIETRNTIRHCIAGGQDHDRNPRAAPAQVAEQLEPGLARQSEVEQQQIIRLERESLLRRSAVAYPVQRESELTEPALHSFADHRVVFGQQQPHRTTPPGLVTRRNTPPETRRDTSSRILGSATPP